MEIKSSILVGKMNVILPISVCENVDSLIRRFWWTVDTTSQQDNGLKSCVEFKYASRQAMGQNYEC